MRALTTIAVEIYQNLKEQHLGLYERIEATKQYILNEITQWNIKTLHQGNNYYFKPDEFKGDENSPPFEIRLVLTPYGYHELKFGNLSASTDEEMFKWDDKDPNRLLKALFLRYVLEKNIIPLLIEDKIEGIMFSPYDGDGLGSDRYSYFYNMFSKLNKNKEFTLKKEGDFSYITKKQ